MAMGSFFMYSGSSAQRPAFWESRTDEVMAASSLRVSLMVITVTVVRKRREQWGHGVGEVCSFVPPVVDPGHPSCDQALLAEAEAVGGARNSLTASVCAYSACSEEGALICCSAWLPLPV